MMHNKLKLTFYLLFISSLILMSCEDPNLEKLIEKSETEKSKEESEKDSTLISSEGPGENLGCNIGVFGPTEINCNDLPMEVSYEAIELEEFGSEKTVEWLENNDFVTIADLDSNRVTLLFEEGFTAVQLTLSVSQDELFCSNTITVDCL